MSGDIFAKAKNMVDIFNEGTIKVIFYDSETAKYSEYSERMFCSDYAIKELKRIIGDENVVAAMTANDRQQRRYSGLRARLVAQS